MELIGSQISFYSIARHEEWFQLSQMTNVDETVAGWAEDRMAPMSLLRWIDERKGWSQTCLGEVSAIRK